MWHITDFFLSILEIQKKKKKCQNSEQLRFAIYKLAFARKSQICEMNCDIIKK